MRIRWTQRELYVRQFLNTLSPFCNALIIPECMIHGVGAKGVSIYLKSLSASRIS